jgi:cytochrome d ubiquinol oxidase subunit I
MLSVLDFDRFLMGFSLGVHIILASIGIALPVIIILAEFLGIRKKDKIYTTLAKRLSLILIVLFAVGTASGTLVALELFLLWPKFMALVGQVAILPVYIEVFAFFLEAIFLAIYMLSWDSFDNKYVHVFFGVLVGIGGAASAILITMLNSFMNTPNGFNISTYLSTGRIVGVNPLAIFSTPATGIEVSHVLATSYFAGAFIFCAYMAYRLLKCDPKYKEYYMKGLKITFSLVVIATFFSVVTGIISINSLASIQPEKYAALEANLFTRSNASEIIGGILINGTLRDYFSIPGLQSALLGSSNAVAPGLNEFPKSTWPPLIVHDTFDLMVFLGFGFGLFVLIVLVLQLIRKKPFEKRWILYLIVIAGGVAVLLLELGWMTAEVGRQPWIIYNVMLVSEAANYSTSIIPIVIGLIVVYALILPITAIMLKMLFRDRELSKELGIP